MKWMFVIFFLVHILCDFYFQTETMALKKRTELKWVVYHSILYGGAAILLFILFLPGLNWRCMACFAISHGVIDLLKFFCKFRSRFWRSERNVFLLDQTIHIFVIFMIVYSLREVDVKILYRVNVQSFFDAFGLSECNLLSWLVKLLLIHKPVNILIAHMLSSYKPSSSISQSGNDKNAGRYIGTLERIIMSVFISLGQYSAVGLVLTAKSITRYDKITKEQDFAEYYLLGTLLSTISAISISLLF